MARDTRKSARAPKKKVSKNIATGVAHVNSSFNNTKILISDVQGNAIAWSSAGTMGFKGSRKSTPYAAQLAAENAGKKAQDHGMRSLEVEVQGPGSGRESALRALAAVGFNITSIRDVTPMAHNGCRPPKRRHIKLCRLDQVSPILVDHGSLHSCSAFMIKAAERPRM